MTDVLSSIPLVGWGPIITIAALAVVLPDHRRPAVAQPQGLALGVRRSVPRRRRRRWRRLRVNTHFAYYDNAADLARDSRTTRPSTAASAGRTSKPQPNGAVIEITVPDTQSKFGNFDAKVWLPPQYFTDPRAHFPGRDPHPRQPRRPTATGSRRRTAASTGLKVAKCRQAGHPRHATGPAERRSRATASASTRSHRATPRPTSPRTSSPLSTPSSAPCRTPSTAASAACRWAAYCALNLGLKHPDLFSVVLDFSGETKPVADTLPGGLSELFGPNWQQQADANNPVEVRQHLDGSQGPAIWMDVGTGDTADPRGHEGAWHRSCSRRASRSSSTPDRAPTTSTPGVTPSLTPSPGRATRFYALLTPRRSGIARPRHC